MANKTKEDAFERVARAREGYLVNASEEYLEALYDELLAWARKVRTEADRRGPRKAFARMGEEL
jgi:hypothetical protein